MGRRHLSPEEVVDLLEGTLDPARAAHLDGCPRCRDRCRELRPTWTLLRSLEVPEPPSAFWEAWSARVRAAIDAEPHVERPTGLFEWWRRPAVALAAGVVVVLIAGGIVWRTASVTRQPHAAASLMAERAASSLGEVSSSHDDEELEWEVLVTLADEADPAPEDLGVRVDQGALEQAVMEVLSPTERQALSALLAAELRNSL